MLPNDPRKSYRWRKLRKSLIGRFPICEAEGCERVATEVHHTIPVMHDPAGFHWFDERSLRCVCHECHVETHVHPLTWKERP